MPLENSFNVWYWYLKHSSDRLEHTKSIWNIFSEESRFCIQQNRFSISMRHSREHILCIPIISVKNSSQSRCVFDRVLVVLDDSLLNGKNQRKINLWIFE